MVGYTVHLYSTNEHPSFSVLTDTENIIEDQQEGSMRVAVQQEDLQLLSRTLQEQFLAEVPSGEFFQIKCAVNKDELMILAQHPVSVKVDTQEIFAVLEEALQSLPPYQDQPVQCFLRIVGEKLPYAKRSLTMKGYRQVESPDIPQDNEDQEDEDAASFSSLALPLSYSTTTDAVEDEEEVFDPLAGTPDLLTNSSQRPLKKILLGTVVGISLLGSGGVYLVTRPCVMSVCQEFQTAQQLNTQFRQLISRARSEKDLTTLQQQLETTSTALGVIPAWSSYYQQAAELKTNLSGRSEKISQVNKALQAASVAEQKMQTPATSQGELQARQQLWRQAITPLEAISPNHELYGLIQPKLLKYRIHLQTINQQLLAQEKWVKKLADAKGVASVANKWETTAKSLKDWQKVQSTWQVVINALNVIPPSSPASQEAQQLLLEYKPKLARARDRVTIEQLAAKSYQQILVIASQAKAYEQKQEWQAAVIYWQQALQAAKQISNNSLYYTQAQSLITPYSASLQQAQEKLILNNSWQQTRADLNKTCSSEIRICNFTVDDKGIIVKITPEYEQVLQSTVSKNNTQDSEAAIGVANHWQTLQEALTVISENANLPLFIYNVQDQVIYMRTPGE
ncbi:conserved hypothetical protein [Trichormus variabilis ATCC 29413]|uniref:Uncharacterized protein n=2 Tax=Anabaena variabilis TaxID=264691 RepID=Q3MC82_TRIV2|nr:MULTISPECIES: hypothetical protein [Nostocaceae]ABA21404.1 conserved hypothetical protein [Trichormus variabilis ATCC 29413]MBC1215853.1 hypothetical protein [Trichormus variabilis ARAD]MBC1257807.1 hypothetical protein [Trichormus variabilis V5]MBC1270395.1 hypothetical protein [Trichormus variabilis FSR]MBC1304849.1 hypothetical protein [Trichormus variabilis N2B]